jgi:hypothetical protein
MPAAPPPSTSTFIRADDTLAVRVAYWSTPTAARETQAFESCRQPDEVFDTLPISTVLPRRGCSRVSSSRNVSLLL